MRLFTFLLSTIIFQIAFSQIPVGHYMDSQGMPIVGYFDPMEYENSNHLNFSIQPSSSILGKYCDKSGIWESAYFKYSMNRFLIRKNSTDNFSALDITNVKALIIGRDSIFVDYVEKYNPDSTVILSSEHRYLQHIASFDQYHVAKVYSSSEKEFLVRKDHSGWISSSVLKKGNNNIFHDFSSIEAVKTAEYRSKLKSQKPIYFDEYEQEITFQKGAKCLGFIRAMDSSMVIDYYKDDVKFKTVTYTPSYPLVRNGLTTYYYPSGVIRKELMYSNDIKNLVKEYFENGQLHYIYMKTSMASSTNNTSSAIPTLYFNAVFDTDGNSLLDQSGNGEEQFMDSINMRLITRIFDTNRISKSFSVDKKGKKTFQWTNGNLGLMSLKTKLKSNVNVSGYKSYSSQTSYFPKLTKVVVDEDGLILGTKSLNKISAPQEINLESFFSRCGFMHYKLKKLKIDGEKVAYEVVIPTEVVIGGMSGYNYNMYNNNWMWQQQMMRPTITPPSPPSFPRF